MPTCPAPLALKGQGDWVDGVGGTGCKLGRKDRLGVGGDAREAGLEVDK